MPLAISVGYWYRIALRRHDHERRSCSQGKPDPSANGVGNVDQGESKPPRTRKPPPYKQRGCAIFDSHSLTKEQEAWRRASVRNLVEAITPSVALLAHDTQSELHLHSALVLVGL